jgi:hypothetical protein
MPSVMRSSTTDVIAALRRMELRCAMSNGRANSPSRNGSTSNIMKPMPEASFSLRNGTRSIPDSRQPHRSVRDRCTSIRMTKYGNTQR